MKWIALFLALLVTPAAAQVRQSGGVTPGHAAAWTTNGIIQDAGTAASGFLNSLGVTTNGPGICQNSGPVSGPYNQVCIGATATGGTLSLTNYNGASGGLQILDNGSPIVIPTTALAAGSGIVFTGTNPTVISLGNIVFPAGSYSTLMTNSGAVTATNGIALSGVTFTNNAIATPGFIVDNAGNIYTSPVLNCPQLTTSNLGKIQCGGGSGSIVISSFTNFSISPTTGFSYTGPANGLNLPVNWGSPFLIYGQITSAAADVNNAGISHVSKYVSYPFATFGSVHPAFAVETSIQNPVNNSQVGIYTAAANFNTTLGVPGQTNATGLIAIATCVVTACTAVTGAAISAYDISGQANPTQLLIGLEVDNNAHGTDNNFQRTGLLIAANTADDAGVANEVTNGLAFFGAGTAIGQGYFGNLVSADAATTLNGINLSGVNFLSGGNAFMSPGFSVDKNGNTTVNSNVGTGGIAGQQCLKAIAGRIGGMGACDDICNPRNFGAQGDGLTDDTTAIQNALNACTTIWMTPGTYLVSNTLTLQAVNSVGIVGSGMWATILKANGTFGSMVHVLAHLRGVRIEHLGLDGNHTVTAGLVFDDPTDYSHIEDLRATNFTGTGILLQGCAQCTGYNLRTEFNGNGLSLLGSGAFPLQWALMDVLSADNANDGYDFIGTGSTSISDMRGLYTFNNGGIGLKVQGIAQFRLSDAFIGGDRGDEVFISGGNGAFAHLLTNVATEASTTSVGFDFFNATGGVICNNCSAATHCRSGLLQNTPGYTVAVNGGNFQSNGTPGGSCTNAGNTFGIYGLNGDLIVTGAIAHSAGSQTFGVVATAAVSVLSVYASQATISSAAGTTNTGGNFP